MMGVLDASDANLSLLDVRSHMISDFVDFHHMDAIWSLQSLLFQK